MQNVKIHYLSEMRFRRTLCGHHVFGKILTDEKKEITCGACRRVLMQRRRFGYESYTYKAKSSKKEAKSLYLAIGPSERETAKIREDHIPKESQHPQWWEYL